MCMVNMHIFMIIKVLKVLPTHHGVGAGAAGSFE
jgi:hypothetical protein